MAQIGKFSDLWIWGVANLRFNYLRCFSINFENCCAHLAANFLYFPNIPNFLYLDGFEETYGQKTKNIGNQKNANLSKHWNLTCIYFYFLSFLSAKNTNIKIHPSSEPAKNNRKTPKNDSNSFENFDLKLVHWGHNLGALAWKRFFELPQKWVFGGKNIEIMPGSKSDQG